MRLLRPSAMFENADPVATWARVQLKTIEKAARTCYKSEGKIKDGSAEALVKKMIARGHESQLEHAYASVRFIVDRGVTHELVRHRIASYSQESTRYVDYTKKNGEADGHVQFILPPWLSLPPGDYDNMDEVRDACLGIPLTEATTSWTEFMLDAEEEYQYLRRNGWSPQEARSVLPNSTKTEIVMTANLREWRAVFKLRVAAAAHPQMREVMIPLLREFHSAAPILFEDIVDAFLPEVQE